MARLKVFGMMVMTKGGVHRAIVAATSQRGAVDAFVGAGFWTTLYEFRMYASETANHSEIDVALSAPGSVFLKEADRQDARWTKAPRGK